MRKTSSYAEKQRRRLVPCRYDRDSRSFLAGAHRHWPVDRRSVIARRMEANDRLALELGRERRMG